MKLTSDKVCVDVEPFPVSLRNADAAREWSARLRDMCDDTSAVNGQRRIANIILRNPEVLDYIDRNGQWNTERIQARTEQLRRDHFAYYDKHKTPKKDRVEPDEAELLEIATREMNESFQRFLLENHEVMRELQFGSITYPVSMDALLLGIDCIRATVNRAKCDDATLALIDSTNESEFWQGVPASEVAEYCNRFREFFG